MLSPDQGGSSMNSTGNSGMPSQLTWPNRARKMRVKTRVFRAPPRERTNSRALSMRGSAADRPAIFKAR